MKKEIIAAALLAAVFTLTMLNVYFLGKITSSLRTMVSDAEALAEKGEWSKATNTAQKALEKWDSYDPYTHITVRHSEIDSTSEMFGNFLGAIYSQDNAAVKSSSLTLRHKLEMLHLMERLTLGSIF